MPLIVKPKTVKPVTVPVFATYDFTKESSQWTVNHNRNTNAFITQIKDINGTLMIAPTTIVSSNTFVVNLTCAMTGSIDVVFSK